MDLHTIKPGYLRYDSGARSPAPSSTSMTPLQGTRADGSISSKQKCVFGRIKSLLGPDSNFAVSATFFADIDKIVIPPSELQVLTEIERVTANPLHPNIFKTSFAEIIYIENNLNKVLRPKKHGTGNLNPFKIKSALDLIPSDEVSFITLTKQIQIPRPTHIEEDVSKLDDFQKAIHFHENNNLGAAAYYLSLVPHAMSMFMLGVLYRHGMGVLMDEEFGFKCLLCACKLFVTSPGLCAEEVTLFTIARNRNGSSLGVGTSTPTLTDTNTIDYSLVGSLFASGIFELGICFMNGYGVHRNPVVALHLFEAAAYMNDADAAMQLGHSYINGQGCSVSKKEAAKWYRLAAKKQKLTASMAAWVEKEKYN